MTDEMDEIWALYADDGAQALDAMEESLDALQSAPADAGSHISALFRAVHTFKGNSRVLGLRNVEALAHVAEDLIGLVRDEGVALTGEILDTLLLSADVLRGMLEETAETHADVEPGPSQKLLSDLRALNARLSGEPLPEAADAETVPDTEEATEQEAPVKDSKPKSKAKPKAKAAADTPSEDAADDLADASADEAVEETSERADVPPETTPELPPEASPAATTPAKPLFDAGLAGLLDQLDGGGFSFDELGDDEEGTTDTSGEGALDEGAAPEAEPAPQVATIAEVSSGKVGSSVLTADPLYRDIFTDMVQKTRDGFMAQLAAWSPSDSPAAARSQADGLAFASNQLDLADWVAALDTFMAGDITEATTKEVLATITALMHRDLGVSEEEAAPVGAETIPSAIEAGRAFFTAVSAFYPEVAAIGLNLANGIASDAAAREDLFAKIIAIAEPQGYVRLADAAQKMAHAELGKGFRAAELDFYEQLIAIERSFPPAVFDADLLAPSTILAMWCADHVFETLQSLREGLDARNSTTDNAIWFPGFETLMRRVHYAAHHFQVETASQLTMALIDLFARIRIDRVAPDVILIQMARGYVDTMELVFDALDQGDTPDTGRIDQMFEEATNVCFVASGVVTAKTIENRLGLPPEFHRVLSPDSVKSAHAGLEEGLHFYVLRADLNNDDALAQGFLEWITSGLVKMITNVTVFLGSETLFDFLVASTLEEDRMIERLALLDPSGARLSLSQALKTRDLPDAEHEAEPDHMDLLPMGDTSDSLALLEAIGAISASHALVEHELSKLATVDLMQDIVGALRAAGVDHIDPRIRNVLRERIEEHSLKLQEISESGTQLSAELSHLQQESVAHRSRPAEVLLRPLKAYVATRSRKGGSEATLTYVGGETVLDQMLIEELRGLLKTLVNLRLAAAAMPTRFHISVEAESDHVRVEITDNSPNFAPSAELTRITEDLHRKKGALRHAILPAGAGVRFHLRVPQHMIVLDGMVVRIGAVRYVLPIDAIQRILQTDRFLPVTAGGHGRMLNMEGEGLVPIRALPPVPGPKEVMPEETSEARLFVIVRSNDRRVAIPVDELLGQQLVLLRPLQGVLTAVRDMSGIAILSGGEVGMVVAVSSIATAA